MKIFLALLLSVLSAFGAASTNVSFFKGIDVDSTVHNEHNLGTIANGGTATLVLTTNVFRAAFSGAAATVALPAITITTNSYLLEVNGTNISGGSLIVSFPPLIREELNSIVPITTITNNTAASFTMWFKSVGGAWVKCAASGDALAFGSGSGSALNFSPQFSVVALTNIFIASGSSITNAALPTPTVTGSLTLETAGVRSTAANGSLTWLGLGTGSDESLTWNFDSVANSVGLSSTTGVTNINTGIIGLNTSLATNILGDLFTADGARLANPLSVYAAGTAYAITATSALLDFGTTDPALVINSPGTYLLIPTTVILYNAATFAANRTVTVKLRRTNNTAADLAGSAITLTTDITTTKTENFSAGSMPAVVYTTGNSNDSITIFADVSVVPSAGSLDCTAASIVAIRLY